MTNVALKRIRIVCAIIFVSCIAGMIVTLIAATAEVRPIVMIATSAVTATRRIDAFDDVRAEGIERRVGELVQAGANEDRVRELVRESIELGRSAT